MQDCNADQHISLMRTMLMHCAVRTSAHAHAAEGCGTGGRGARTPIFLHPCLEVERVFLLCYSMAQVPCCGRATHHATCALQYTDHPFVHSTALIEEDFS